MAGSAPHYRPGVDMYRDRQQAREEKQDTTLASLVDILGKLTG